MAVQAGAHGGQVETRSSRTASQPSRSSSQSFRLGAGSQSNALTVLPNALTVLPIQAGVQIDKPAANSGHWSAWPSSWPRRDRHDFRASSALGPASGGVPVNGWVFSQHPLPVVRPVSSDGDPGGGAASPRQRQSGSPNPTGSDPPGLPLTLAADPRWSGSVETVTPQEQVP